MSACPNCGSTKLILDHRTGELKCSDCGYVIEEGAVDLGPEWRAYNEEQRLARARAEPVKFPTQLYTVIGRGSGLSAAKRVEFARLSLLQSSVSGEEDRSIRAGMDEISRLTAAAQLPQQVRDEAFRLFVRAQRAGLLRGSSVACVAAACIVLACREFGFPNPALKLCELAGLDPSRVRHSYALLLQHLGVKPKPPSPLKYLPMIASKLGLSMKTQRTAAEIIRAAQGGLLLLGKPPRSIAAAALYIASSIHGERRSRSAFAAAAGVTETTLRKRVRELVKRLDVYIYV